MKNSRRMRAAALLIAALVLLSGCAAFPFSNAAKPEIFVSLSSGEERAEGMARDLCVVTGAEPEPDSGIQAEAAGVFAGDGSRTAVQKNVTERLYPASMTKVMTALLVLENADPADVVTVGQEAVITEPGASLAHLAPGDSLTVEQLLYGLMLPSGNDAAASLAVHVSGSTEAFAELMNSRARRLGALGTHFVNPHGLHDENHYTTAYDMYLIFREALKNETFRQIIGTTSYTARYRNAAGEDVERTWENSNRYLKGESPVPEGFTVLGGKTGTTKAAGSCLVMASEDASGLTWISIVMKSDTRDHLYDAMSSILSRAALF